MSRVISTFIVNSSPRLSRGRYIVFFPSSKMCHRKSPPNNLQNAFIRNTPLESSRNKSLIPKSLQFRRNNSALVRFDFVRTSNLLSPDSCKTLENEAGEAGIKMVFDFLRRHLERDDTFMELMLKLGLRKTLASFLNDPLTPPEIIERAIPKIRNDISRSWRTLLEGRSPEELPRVLQFCAEVVAEYALAAYSIIRQVTEISRKPTLTVYILSTAYKLNIEDFSYKLQEEGYGTKESCELIRRFKEKVAYLESLGCSTFEARMKTGEEWLKEGILTKFSTPIFLKIPSGSAPCTKVVQQLQQIGKLAKRNNWDIIFIDYSTVRKKSHIYKRYQGHVPELEKGRAIARGLELTDPLKLFSKWIYKGNNWAIPPLSLEVPNIIGLNLFDGRLFKSLHGANMSEWLPTDDHAELTGVHWDDEGNPEFLDLFVLMQSKNGGYYVSTASSVFDKYLAQEIEEMRKAI